MGVDARHLRAGRGVARYTRGMLDALAAEVPDDELQLSTPGPVASKLVFGSAAVFGRPRAGAGADVF